MRRRGRPPIYGVRATVRIELRVTPAQRLTLRRVADARGGGVAGVIREAIADYVDDDDRHPPRLDRRSGDF